MKSTKQLSDEEQAEARLAGAHDRFMATMARINRDHDAHVRRIDRAEKMLVRVVWFVCIGIGTVIMAAALHARHQP